MNNTKSFKVSPVAIDVFGGGHIPYTLPMKWETKCVEGSEVDWTLLGRRDNAKGCFTIVELFERDYPMYLVAYYVDKTPEEISTDLQDENKILPDDFIEVHDQIHFGIFNDIKEQMPEMFV